MLVGRSKTHELSVTRRSWLQGAIAMSACGVASSLGFASKASADIYSYTDSDGVVHFTNIRPGAQARARVVMRTRTPRASDPARAQRSYSRSGAERYRSFDAHIAEAANLYRIPEALIRAVIRVESDFQVSAYSRVGAQGLMQLMPGTARGMGVTDAYNPRQNILGGTRYLRVLANMFSGDLILTVAGYNAGGGAVQRHRGVPPYAETQNYVRAVLGWYHHFMSNPESATPASR